MDVGDWLRSLGLGQYEGKFRDNKIEADVLPQLTADDLKDIGVSAVGDRRRLLAAIGALAGATPSAPIAPSEASPETRTRVAREASPDGVSSRSCFATSWGRRRCPPSSILRSCAM